MTDSSSSDFFRNLESGHRYRVEELLGGGSMGEVYRVFDSLLNEYVALKVLRASLNTDEQAVRHFLQEVSLTRKIIHPNVIRTYDA